MQQKSQEERRVTALIMITAKAVEGCTPCLEGLKHAAEEAGAAQKEIEFAAAIGMRTGRQLFGATESPAPSITQLSNGTVKAEIQVVTGDAQQQFLETVMANANVQILDTHFRSLGFHPVEAARGMARLQYDDHTCLEAYLPYQFDTDHISWISYREGRSGTDLVGTIMDLSQKSEIEAGRLPHESLIIQGGTVIPGHACDGNCFGQNLFLCCGPSWVGCLQLGPFWWACTTAVCGSCAVVSCFACGCC